MQPQQRPVARPPVGRVILTEYAVKHFGTSDGRRPLRAGVSAVYATKDGSVVWLGRPLRRFEALLGGYRTRYEVSTADWEGEFDLANELPSHDDVFRFYARVQLGFRVHDAAEVVRRRVQDGFRLARWRLVQQMRAVSRRYPTEKCAQANDEINERLGGEPLVLEEGITVYRFAAFLSLDRQTQAALQRKRATEIEHEIQRLTARQNWELEQGRITAVRLALQGDFGLLVLHLARHPEDTEGLLQMVAKSREDNRQAQIEMFRSMVEHDVIQGIELQEIRDENLRQILLAARADGLQELQLDQPNRGSAPISGQVTREVADEPPPSIPLPRTSGGARPADAA